MSDRRSQSRSPSPVANGDRHRSPSGSPEGRPRSRSRSFSRSPRRSRSRTPVERRRVSRSPRRRSNRSRSRSPRYRSRSPRRDRFAARRSPPRYGGSFRGGGGGGGGRGGGGSGYPDNPQPSRCIGIFGLSLYTSERDLRDYFGKFGPIEDVQLVYDHPSGRSRGFGFIYYERIDDAIEARERAAGIELDGHRIRVDFSLTKRPHSPTPGRYMGRRSGGRSPYDRSRGRSRSYSRSPRRY